MRIKETSYCEVINPDTKEVLKIDFKDQFDALEFLINYLDENPNTEELYIRSEIHIKKVE